MANAKRNKQKNDWQREHVDRINLTIPKGQKEAIKSHAQTHGESTNRFICRAIDETMKRDQEKDMKGQHIIQLAAESDKSIEAEENNELEEKALAILQREVPSIRKIYDAEKQRQQVNRDIPPVTAIRGNN